MNILQLLISLASGVGGGNAVGPVLKEKNMGPLANSIIGLLGGGLGGWVLQALDLFAKSGAAEALGAPGGIDIGHLVANVASSGIGGALLTAAVAYVKSSLNK